MTGLIVILLIVGLVVTAVAYLVREYATSDSGSQEDTARVANPIDDVHTRVVTETKEVEKVNVLEKTPTLMHRAPEVVDQDLASLKQNALGALRFGSERTNVPAGADIYHDFSRGRIALDDGMVLESPTHDHGAMFGSSFHRLSDGRSAVGARGYPMSTGAGAVFLYDAGGNLSSIVNHPNPFLGAMFGWSIESIDLSDESDSDGCILFIGAPMQGKSGDVYAYHWPSNARHPVLAGVLSKEEGLLRTGSTLRKDESMLYVGCQLDKSGAGREIMYELNQDAKLPNFDQHDGTRCRVVKYVG